MVGQGLWRTAGLSSHETQPTSNKSCNPSFPGLAVTFIFIRSLSLIARSLLLIATTHTTCGFSVQTLGFYEEDGIKEREVTKSHVAKEGKGVGWGEGGGFNLDDGTPFPRPPPPFPLVSVPQRPEICACFMLLPLCNKSRMQLHGTSAPAYLADQREQEIQRQ